MKRPIEDVLRDTELKITPQFGLQDGYYLAKLSPEWQAAVAAALRAECSEIRTPGTVEVCEHCDFPKPFWSGCDDDCCPLRKVTP